MGQTLPSAASVGYYDDIALGIPGTQVCSSAGIDVEGPSVLPWPARQVIPMDPACVQALIRTVRREYHPGQREYADQTVFLVDNPCALDDSRPDTRTVAFTYDGLAFLVTIETRPA